MDIASSTNISIGHEPLKKTKKLIF